jgi:glycosyltransferase involved in cell wall biosynthesis
MKSLRILIISYFWPPQNTIGTHRPLSWANYWSEFGAEVTVLTAKKQTFDEPLDLVLPIHSTVKVVEVNYNSALNKVWAALRVSPARMAAKRLKAFIRRSSMVEADPRSAWREKARTVALGLCCDVDVIVSSFGPPAAHLLANDMKVANPALFWVADYRDLWSQRHSDEASESLRAAMRKQELETVGARADLLVSVSFDLTRQLSGLTGKKAVRITNGFDHRETPISSIPLRKPQPLKGDLRIVYTGTIYKDFQDLTPVLNALVALNKDRAVKEPQITLAIYGPGVSVAEQFARNPAYSRYLRLMGYLPREQVLQVQRSADVLLLLENAAPEARGILTGKLFEYLAAGRPILCVGSNPEYEIGQILNETRTGRVIGPDNYADLSGLLKETLDGQGLYENYNPDITALLQYTRKHQADLLLRYINDHANERASRVGAKEVL